MVDGYLMVMSTWEREHSSEHLVGALTGCVWTQKKVKKEKNVILAENVGSRSPQPSPYNTVAAFDEIR